MIIRFGRTHSNRILSMKLFQKRGGNLIKMRIQIFNSHSNSSSLKPSLNSLKKPN
jgi:hypothetical protein